MKPLVGIFPSPTAAVSAFRELREAGLTEDQLLLTAQLPESTDSQAVATAEPGSPPGACGLTEGHMVGALTGFAGGLLGGAAVSFFVPGIGPVLALGALALSTLLGVTAGGAIGGAVQDTFMPELPYDHRFVYIEALRRGHWLVIAEPRDEAQEETTERILTRFGAEGLEAR
jgi:hypothetical protein